MTLNEFLSSDLERVQEKDLKEGDIFSYGLTISDHVFVRRVTKVFGCIFFNTVINDRFQSPHKGVKSERYVSRIKKHKDYDPKQQPFDENDI